MTQKQSPQNAIDSETNWLLEDDTPTDIPLKTGEGERGLDYAAAAPPHPIVADDTDTIAKRVLSKLQNQEWVPNNLVENATVNSVQKDHTTFRYKWTLDIRVENEDDEPTVGHKYEFDDLTEDHIPIDERFAQVSSYTDKTVDYYELHEDDAADGEGLALCPTCGGTETETCPKCDGRTEIRCTNCTRGEIETSDGTKHPCPKCQGDRVITCPKCEGDHWVTCSTCFGEGEVYKVTTGTVVYEADYQLERIGDKELPLHTLDYPSGLGTQVDVRDPSVKSGSDEVDVTRRETEIRIVPIVKLSYDYNGDTYEAFWVDGEVLTEETPPVAEQKVWGAIKSGLWTALYPLRIVTVPIIEYAFTKYGNWTIKRSDVDMVVDAEATPQSDDDEFKEAARGRPEDAFRYTEKVEETPTHIRWSGDGTFEVEVLARTESDTVDGDAFDDDSFIRDAESYHVFIRNSTYNDERAGVNVDDDFDTWEEAMDAITEQLESYGWVDRRSIPSE